MMLQETLLVKDEKHRSKFVKLLFDIAMQCDALTWDYVQWNGLTTSKAIGYLSSMSMVLLCQQLL